MPYCPVPDHNCQPRSPSTPRRPGGPMPSGARQSPRGRCRGCRRSCECAAWILRETGGSCSSDSSQRSDPQVSGAGTYCSSRHVAANFGCLPRSCLPLFPTVSRSLLPSPISNTCEFTSPPPTSQSLSSAPECSLTPVEMDRKRRTMVCTHLRQAAAFANVTLSDVRATCDAFFEFEDRSAFLLLVLLVLKQGARAHIWNP